MSWKKFPSQGLTSLSNTATLTDVWVPRWSNTFGTDILPTETPVLLSGLPQDDKENLLEDDEEENVYVFFVDGVFLDKKNKKVILFLLSLRIKGSDDATSGKIFLTPEMVNAQFNIPDIYEARERHFKEE